ncbi:hypothetical protein Ddye_023521 [Dipteronia dyeriana]|uniref:RNA-directed DNA polymerase, eukaryota, reverse transcriptase zinc-binding domain protein n=1 Tax=Dipteronia dyeriana TaxID=168575 RepID=A0AAD9TTP7_9ROSI|nr:hypothetical protein Ddye_023521 [Dipteronia dyeriana]
MQFQLCSKIQNLNKALKSLNTNTVGDVTVKSIEAKATLVDCQRLLDMKPLDEGLRIDVTNDEICEVCFSFHPNKGPGLVGFNPHFFKKMWHVVGDDMINAIQEFFHSGLFLKKLYATIRAFVTKVSNLS